MSVRAVELAILFLLQFGSRGPSPMGEVGPQPSTASGLGSMRHEEDSGLSEERRISAAARRVLQRVDEEGEGADPLEAWKQRAEEVVGDVSLCRSLLQKSLVVIRHIGGVLIIAAMSY